MPRGYFITATGTDLGKTMITAALVWQLRQQGKPVRAIKPMASGVSAGVESDTDELLAAQGLPVSAKATITPWSFARPVSPHLAAPATLQPADIVGFCEGALAQEGVTLIEGAGGVFTPLLHGYTQADLLADLNVPALVVCGSYVGAISHTIATVEALRARRLNIAALCISESEESATTLAETQAALHRHIAPSIQMFTVPRISLRTSREVPIWQQVPPLTGVLCDGS